MRTYHTSGIGFNASEHVVNVCLIGAGAACCRFLVGSFDGNGLTCGKLEPALARQIAARHAAGAFVARGDNCPGRKPDVPL